VVFPLFILGVFQTAGIVFSPHLPNLFLPITPERIEGHKQIMMKQAKMELNRTLEMT